MARKTIAETFDDHWVGQPGPLTTPCHIWQKATMGRYGVLWYRGKNTLAHRFAFQRACGHIPLNRIVTHLCDTPLCVNHEHLTVGTHSSNAAERELRGRGRQAKGSAHYKAVLTEELVSHLRSIHIPRHPKFGCTALARANDIARTTLSGALHGKWNHVPNNKNNKGPKHESLVDIRGSQNCER